MSLTLYPLGDYIQLLQRKNLQLEFSGAPLTREVSLVSCDSRQVVPGTLFICKGAHFKVEFLQSAKEQGAFAYLSEKRYDQVDLPCILVSDVRLAMALLADFYYNHPSAKLGVVGITGTKGKSSTAYYLKYIFDEYLAAKGQPASGVISSIETYDGVEKFESHLTTPEPLDLERHFANGVATGMRYLTMEVSSQALKYDRVKNVEFAAAVFLNIGMDHISPIEHPDFEDYFASKLRIFSQAAAACVNLDCDHADRVLAAARAAGKRIAIAATDERNTAGRQPSQRKNPYFWIATACLRKTGNTVPRAKPGHAAATTKTAKRCPTENTAAAGRSTGSRPNWTAGSSKWPVGAASFPAGSSSRRPSRSRASAAAERSTRAFSTAWPR